MKLDSPFSISSIELNIFLRLSCYIFQREPIQSTDLSIDLLLPLRLDLRFIYSGQSCYLKSIVFLKEGSLTLFSFFVLQTPPLTLSQAPYFYWRVRRPCFLVVACPCKLIVASQKLFTFFLMGDQIMVDFSLLLQTLQSFLFFLEALGLLADFSFLSSVCTGTWKTENSSRLPPFFLSSTILVMSWMSLQWLGQALVSNFEYINTLKMQISNAPILGKTTVQLVSLFKQVLGGSRASVGFTNQSGIGFFTTTVLAMNLSSLRFTTITPIRTLIELLEVFPLGVPGEGLVRVTVLTALDDDDNVLIGLGLLVGAGHGTGEGGIKLYIFYCWGYKGISFGGNAGVLGFVRIGVCWGFSDRVVLSVYRTKRNAIFLQALSDSSDNF